VSVLPAFDLVRPVTVDDALGEISDDRLPYTGGTEILLAMRAGLLRPAVLVDLKGVSELARLEAADGWLQIGASVTHHDASRHPGVTSNLPLLADVLARVGNARVRISGTLGGNLCFAEPKSDVPTALLALDANVVLRSPRGDRTLSVGDFVIGPYTTDRQPDELLVRIDIPLQRLHRGVYVKHQTMERPTVGVAAMEWHDGGRRRLVVGAVSERPLAFDAEDGEIDPDAVAEAVEPIPDLSGSARYKRHVTRVLARRALAQLEAA
jgi:aerobic carbon-monoxide dehydrogenase medium subunit